MTKVAFGVPYYGPQSAKWWVPFLREALTLSRNGIEFVDVLTAGTMMTDKNRNEIVKAFLASDAEWLFWVDADNTNPLGTVKRLLDTAGSDRTLVAGIYFGKSDPHQPIAYERVPSGRYANISHWERGEILRVDAAGMNSLLSHRKVYEDIDKNYVALEFLSGGVISVHRDDIEGDVFDNTEYVDRVVDGVWQRTVKLPEKAREPGWFHIGFNRTEDFSFFEKASRCGHDLWIDTSVEAGHIGDKEWGGGDWRSYVESLSDRESV